MSESSRPALAGQRLFIVLVFALSLMTGAIWLLGDGGIDSVRLIIRATARTSLAFFLTAFTASAIERLWPGRMTRWILRNRRWFGLAFAFSHAIHAGALIVLHNRDAALFWSLTNTRAVIAGTSAYVVIALMASTSFDRIVAAIGPAAWRKVHSVGSWYIWLFFLISNGKRIPVSLGYLVPVMLLLGASWVRIRARRNCPSSLRAA